MNQVSNLRVKEVGCKLTKANQTYIFISSFLETLLNDSKEILKGKPKEQKEWKGRGIVEK